MKARLNNVISVILTTIENEEPILRSLSEEMITTRFNHQNRSIKMLIGHLVDSASNNHRFNTVNNKYKGTGAGEAQKARMKN